MQELSFAVAHSLVKVSKRHMDYSSEAIVLFVWMSSVREKCIKVGTFQYLLEDREEVNYLRSQKKKKQSMYEVDHKATDY